MLNIRPSIELCCHVVFDLSCNGLFRFFFFVLFVFLLLLPLMANKVVCVCVCMYKRRRMSVCMSVRPSVTSRYHVKTNAHSPDTLNFETNCPIINPRKPPPCEGFKRDMGWVKKRQKWKFSTDKLCLGNSYNRRLIGSPIGTNFDDLE